MKFCKKNAKRNKRSIPKVFKGKPYPPRIKLTLTVKSWTDALWDWLAIARTDCKLQNKGLENPVLVGGEKKERGKNCEKRKWVCLELYDICLANKKDAVMGPKI
jgi:hypothetical protein